MTPEPDLSTPSDLPIILLVFSNETEKQLDGSTNDRYLEELEVEKQEIKKAIEEANENAIKKGSGGPICQLEILDGREANIQGIYDKFIIHEGRIAVFHFAGHADGYQLLLQSVEKDQPKIAHAGGLIAFFRQQASLKLLFLNGCETHQQAKEIYDAGIPAVIGTNCSIEDTLARKFAHQFYRNLAMGVSLVRAWEYTLAFIRSETDASPDLYLEQGKRGIGIKLKGDSKKYSWDLYTQSFDWNLGSEAKNPVFGLPTPIQNELPKAPFRYLERYQAAHAEIFFGRGREIRRLFSLLISKQDAPLILFHGQSGVGKSSVLEAGLFPRLKARTPVLGNRIVFARRDSRKGLLDTLKIALAESLKPYTSDTAEEMIKETVFQLVESHLASIAAVKKPEGKPVTEKSQNPFYDEIPSLVIVLDQAEESFTRPLQGVDPIEQEWQQFLQALSPLLLNPHFYATVKVVLSFRKEFHPEIKTYCQRHGLRWEDVFLKPLDAQGIREVVMGIQSTPRLYNVYQVEVQEFDENQTSKSLPASVAEDLMEDKYSPISPILQIQLSELWEMEKSKKTGRQFNYDKYKAVKRQGDGKLEQFFKEQLQKLKAKEAQKEDSLSTYINAGLALDLLHVHTTEMGTAEECHFATLCEIYISEEENKLQKGISKKDLQTLIQELIDLRLLLEMTDGTTTRLAHDTIAPIVRKAFANSKLPGQQAAHILSSKVQFIPDHLPEQGKPGAKPEATILLAADGKVRPSRMGLMFHQLQYFAAGTADDSDPSLLELADLRIIEEGQKGMRKWNEKEKVLVEKNQHIRNKRVIKKQRSRIGIIGLAMIISVIGLIGLRKLADNQSVAKKLKAYEYLLTQDEPGSPKNTHEKDLTNASQAFLHTFPDRDTLILDRLVSSKAAAPQQPGALIALDTLELSPDFLYNVMLNTGVITLSPNGQHILYQEVKPWQEKNQAQLFSLDTLNNQWENLTTDNDSLIATAFLPDGNSLGIALKSGENNSVVLIKDIRSQGRAHFSRDTLPYLINSLDFAQDTPLVVMGTADSTLLIWNYQEKELDTLPHSGKAWVKSAIWSPDHQHILAELNIPDRWDETEKFFWRFDGQWSEKKITYDFTDFSANRKQFVGSQSGVVTIIDYSGENLQEVKTNISFPARTIRPYFDVKGNIIVQIENRAWVFKEHAKGNWLIEDLFEFKNELLLIHRSNQGEDLFFLTDEGELFQARDGKSPIKWVEEQGFSLDTNIAESAPLERQKLATVLSNYYDGQDRYFWSLKVILLLAFINYLAHFYFSYTSWDYLISRILGFLQLELKPFLFFNGLIATILVIYFMFASSGEGYLSTLSFIGGLAFFFNILQLWKSYRAERYSAFFLGWLPLFLIWMGLLGFFALDFDFGKYGFLKQYTLVDDILFPVFIMAILLLFAIFMRYHPYRYVVKLLQYLSK